jgi:hypothetical protein
LQALAVIVISMTSGGRAWTRAAWIQPAGVLVASAAGDALGVHRELG